MARSQIKCNTLMKILAAVTLVAALVGSVAQCVRMNLIDGSYHFALPFRYYATYAGIFLVASIIFAVYMFRGRTSRSFALPAVCVLTGVAGIAAKIVNISSFGKISFNQLRVFLTIDGIIFYLSTLVICVALAVCAAKGFRHKWSFTAFSFIAILLYAFKYLPMLVSSKGFFAGSVLEMARGMIVYVPILLIVSLFVFGLTNTTDRLGR